MQQVLDQMLQQIGSNEMTVYNKRAPTNALQDIFYSIYRNYEGLIDKWQQLWSKKQTRNS